jgi:hypothetical protein
LVHNNLRTSTEAVLIHEKRSTAVVTAGIPLMDRDRDLDPLRDRPDFRLLILDGDFPSEPLAGP